MRGAATTTTYAWVFKAPDALLYDMNFVPGGACTAPGRAGPRPTAASSWRSEMARADAPLPDAIPWLLLKELSTSGPGVFSDVAIVQRLNTAGGVAPATGCDASTVEHRWSASRTRRLLLLQGLRQRRRGGLTFTPGPCT